MKKFLVVVLGVLVALAATTFEVKAQVQSFYNGTNSYSKAELLAATAIVDTVTDAGAGAVYTKTVKGDGRVTIQVDVTKVSGAVAGTITLEGSVDGVTYDIINTEETQTAIAPKALANATDTYHWRLKENDFVYYKVGTAGGTTCVYYLSAQMLKH
jgi:hypothetical protein